MRCFKYTNRPKSYITVTTIDDPYGDGTGAVVSIGCTLKGDTQNPTWKVHVPLDLADGVAQEISRLVALSRKKSSEKSRSANILSRIDDDGNIAVNSETVCETPPVDKAALSFNAQTMGRVIKRQK
jgi:hypothetical protein